MGQLDPETESPCQGKMTGKERTCLNVTQDKTELPLFAYSEYLLEHPACLNRAYPSPPKKRVLPHTIPNDS